jgi:hypothetical protein
MNRWHARIVPDADPPAGDQWVVIAEFEARYWRGTPVDG